jgi:hypothetical protein
MNRHFCRGAAAIISALFAPGVFAGAVSADFSVLTDMTFYVPEAPAQGMLFSNNEVFVAPAISLFADLKFGDRILLHGLLDADRGFDPGMKLDGDVRFDEYYLQAEVLDNSRLDVRVGKFATVFGNWVPRHFATDNPLITAPMLYGNFVPISDSNSLAGVPAFAARRNRKDNKEDWVSVVWGPSYATGASITAHSDTVDFAVEVKNAALSSRPNTWDAINDGFDSPPTVTGRLGWRGAPEWSLGTSFSRGPYLSDNAKANLPNGAQNTDYEQTTGGIDGAYAHHRFQVWTELAAVRFEVPRVGNVEALTGYVEARYKITPQIWLAGRWNQSWFDDVPGRHLTWARDYRRLDVGLGYRYNEHIQTKLQYSLGDQAGDNVNGRNLGVWQTTIWF